MEMVIHVKYRESFFLGIKENSSFLYFNTLLIVIGKDGLKYIL